MLKQMRLLSWLEVVNLVSMLLCLSLIVLALIVPNSFTKAALAVSFIVTLIVAKMEYNSSNAQESQ